MTDSVCEIKVIDEKNYFDDKKFVSYSSIKMFSKCETLYRDIIIDKVYEQPNKDYFVYGSLVDEMVTEGPEVVAEHFVRVERKINTEDVLKFENKIKNLQQEIAEKKIKIKEKNSTKEKVILEKMKGFEKKATDARKKEKDSDVEKFMGKVSECNDKIQELYANPDKVLAKGIESREAEIVEVQTSLGQVKELANKQQVTPAIWSNAEATALALKTHPYYSQMEFNSFTSQQVFACEIDGVPRKGKLDHLKLSPAMSQIYSVWVAKQLSTEDFLTQIAALNPADKWAIITDIKTCFDMAQLEPYNPHYRGQLRFYQDLVHHCLGIPLENIRCQIFAADKVSDGFKKAELFVYPQNVLDELWPDVLAWIQIWKNAVDTNTFVSAKAKLGMQQKCFLCTECRNSPFAQNPGEAVVVTGPRFSQK